MAGTLPISRCVGHHDIAVVAVRLLGVIEKIHAVTPSRVLCQRNIYSHVTPTMQRDAVERLASLMNGTP